MPYSQRRESRDKPAHPADDGRSLEERRAEIERRMEEASPAAEEGSGPVRRSTPRRSPRRRSAAPSGDGERGLAYLVLDCSASMGGEKMGQAVAGAVGFARKAIGDGYHVGAIGFNFDAFMLITPTASIGDVEGGGLNGVLPSGHTNMGRGLKLALSGIRERREDFARRAVVVATDGYPGDPEEALSYARDLRSLGARIITVGTEDADRGFLEALSNASELASLTTDAGLGLALAEAAGELPAGEGRLRR